jgi:uncharacterized protein with PIN domain/sulfur carrier protein ThiS
MRTVCIRFYAELGDLLPTAQRGREFSALFSPGRTVKDLIEGLGVPHTEVDLVLVNGHSVDFSHVLSAGDRVSVYPMFEAFDISSVTQVRPAPLRQPRFVLDVHLGRLAVLLRLAGFDSCYRNDLEDREIVTLAQTEHRTILTRDRGLLKRRAVTHGYLVRATDPRSQLAEVVDHFDLRAGFEPFSRCPLCNGSVEAVAKADVSDALPPHTALTHHDFYRCRACRHVYWKGSHYRAIMRLLDQMRSPRRTE